MKDAENLKKAVESLGGEFELIRELGRGATAVVYLLRDHALDRDLAMKVIRATLGGDEEAVARLQREARLVAQLMHPNIVKLYGTHRLPDGSLALLMEHVPGRNLKEVLRDEGAFSVAKTMRVLKDVASALAYAHRRRIVHRDVKPENIYLDEEVGAARLADFGVARPWDQDARLTIPGASLGTPAYMSPEQIDGNEVDGRTDVYSLGLVGYELLLGHHPWEGENVFTIIFRQKNEELPIETLGLVDAPVLARTLEKALEKDPEARLESAMAFLEELSEEMEIEEESGDLAPIRLNLDDQAGSPFPGAVRDDDQEGTLAPMDWSTVEVDTAVGGKAFDQEFPGDSELGTFVSSQAPLGIRPRRRWGPILAFSALALSVASYGIYQFLPESAEATDPGTFSSAPTALTGTPVEMPPEAPDDAALQAELALAPETPTSGPPGSSLQLTAMAQGVDGAPLRDTLVLFQVEEGDGTLELSEARTNSEGVVEVGVLLPNSPGVTVVLASVSGSQQADTRFEVFAESGVPQRIVPLVGDQQSGLPGNPLPEYLGVRVMDEFGNLVPEVEVRFEILQGDGQIAPEIIRTDDVGRAFTRWTLGAIEGPQWAAASVPGFEGVQFTFQATARAAPPVEVEALPEEETPTAPPAPEPVRVVARTFSIGGSHVCHVSGGRAICRGANDRGQGGDGSVGGLIGLSTGVSHGCGLNAEGEGWCWGANDSGQLGDGSTVDSPSGTALDTDTRFSVLAPGLSHTCGLGPGGAAFCWGRNVVGQLGDGSRTDHSRPGPVGGGHTFQEIVAGWNHSCGIVGGNRAYCWGSNAEGQLGDGFRVDRLVPTRIPGTFQTLAAGASHTCGIRGEEVFCWGDNAFGQLGDGTNEDRLSPVRVIDLPGPPLVLASGAVHSCALLRDRSAYCWGQNLHGQLGDGTTQNRSSPVMVSGGVPFITLFAGGGLTCGFGEDGTEYCWGLNQKGQLGDGTRTNRPTPVSIGGTRPQP